jgi:putative heme iron utilization protein
MGIFCNRGYLLIFRVCDLGSTCYDLIIRDQSNENMLKDLLSDIIKIDDVLFIVRTGGAITEMRSNALNLRQKDNWVTIGDNDGPCHMHVDTNTVAKIQFVKEQKENRTSYSVRFFDKDGEKLMSAVFSKMFDDKMTIKPDRKKLYDDLFQKYGANETITF